MDIEGVKVHRRSSVIPKRGQDDVAKLLARFGPSIKLMGGGAYAKVYRIEPTPQSHQALELLGSKLTHAVVGARIKKGPVILKVGLPDKGEPWAVFVKRSTRENAAHLAIQMANSSIVPTLYFAGAVGRTYVAAMEVASGVTLAQYIEQHSGIPRKVYANLQHAVITMLAAGIVHGDLHDENVLVAPDGSVKVIDFGFAVQLSPDQRKTVQSLVHTDTDAAWNAIGGYVNAVQAQRIRGLTWYNPEVKALRVWRSLVFDAPTGTVSPTGVLSVASGSTASGSASVHSGHSRSARSARRARRSARQAQPAPRQAQPAPRVPVYSGPRTLSGRARAYFTRLQAKRELERRLTGRF